MGGRLIFRVTSSDFEQGISSDFKMKVLTVRRFGTVYDYMIMYTVFCVVSATGVTMYRYLRYQSEDSTRLPASLTADSDRMAQ